ncbi:DegT/DnrJ/EryC1/StrS family aminotransferase [Ferrovibrio sp.]|uniref:DegT/DnrJ/EryC1/StrS family aminotransferase n=1 Tax=Ferrovibrio sp. TaxID=1917215 RepID=UPI0035AEFB4C
MMALLILLYAEARPGRPAAPLHRAPATTTSFFPSKPLGCYGDGGASFIEDDGVEDVLRSIRVHGKGDDKYDIVRVGANSRLDAIQATVLLAEIPSFLDEL